MSPPTCLLVCTGKDCRKDKGFKEIVELAGDIGGAREVHCQDVCHGPMVGIQRGEHVRWFSRIRSKSLRKSVVEAITQGHVAKDLKEHEDSKHRDEIRGRHRMRSLDRHRAKLLSH